MFGALATGLGWAIWAARSAAGRIRADYGARLPDRLRQSLPEPGQVYRIIIALDIEQFGNPQRDDRIRVQLRRALHRTVSLALAATGVPGGRWRASSTGDGLLLLVEPTIETARVLRALLDRLPTLLDNYNRFLVPLARLRIRIVLHSAHIMLDEHGASGEQVNLLFRILDADTLRSWLAATRAASILAISEDIYRQVVCQRALDLDPRDFQPVVVEVKETRAQAWIYTPPGRVSASATCQATVVEELMGDLTSGTDAA